MLHTNASVILAFLVVGSQIQVINANVGLRVIGSQSGAQSKTAVVPIEIDEYGLWYGNFSVGATQSQRLHIEVDTSLTLFYTNDYHPSSRSKRDGVQSIPVSTPTNGSYGEVEVEKFTDVIGITSSSLQANASVNVIKKIVPAERLPEAFYATLPLVGQVGWFHNLCRAGIAECRFGLAMTRKKKGALVLGQADKSFYRGDLAVSRVESYPFWNAQAEVVLNDKTHLEQVPVLFVTGLRTILGPTSLVREIFSALNITEIGSKTDQVVRGYFPCDKPPTFGFSFPMVQSLNTPNKEQQKAFNIAPSAFTHKRMGSNKCEAVLQGISSQLKLHHQQVWYIGYPFYEERYVDFNVDDSSIGIAPLKDSHAISGFEKQGGAMSESNRVCAAMRHVIILSGLIITAGLFWV